MSSCDGPLVLFIPTALGDYRGGGGDAEENVAEMESRKPQKGMMAIYTPTYGSLFIS